MPKTRTAVAMTGEEGIPVMDRELACRVIRKIDLRLITIMFITYNFNFIDKSILSSAAVFGLRHDNDLVGTQYSWVSSAFYFGYLIWEYPSSLLIQRLPIKHYLAAVTVIWGGIVAATAGCSSFGGLVTVRVLLGMAEATISPCFVFLTSMWYTRDEIPVRTGIWFSGNSVGGFIASLAAYGLGQIKEPLHPWQWMFIVFGVATTFWGVIMFFALPSDINSASFLTEEEKQYAEDRIVLAGTGRTDGDSRKWKPDQAIETLMDPKTWMLMAIIVLNSIPNGGINSFGNIVITSFGFTALQSTLITLPSSVIAALTIAGSGWIASRYRNTTTYLLVIVVVFPVVGSSIIYTHQSKGVQLFAYYCLQTAPASLPLALGLVGTNFKGVTKKLTFTALLFVCYCAGNIAGPQFFLSSEAKAGYPTAFKAILVCYALLILMSIVLRFYFTWENKRRDRKEGLEDGLVVERENRENKELVTEDYEDITDFKTKGFRYRY